MEKAVMSLFFTSIPMEVYHQSVSRRDVQGPVTIENGQSGDVSLHRRGSVASRCLIKHVPGHSEVLNPQSLCEFLSHNSLNGVRFHTYIQTSPFEVSAAADWSS